MIVVRDSNAGMFSNMFGVLRALFYYDDIHVY
jgi:hypothetical protein